MLTTAGYPIASDAPLMGGSYPNKSGKHHVEKPSADEECGSGYHCYAGEWSQYQRDNPSDNTTDEQQVKQIVHCKLLISLSSFVSAQDQASTGKIHSESAR